MASVAGTFAGVCIKHSVGGLCCGDLCRCLHQTQCGWPLLRGPSQVFASNTVWVASVAGTSAGVCIKHNVGGLCCGDLRRCLHQTQCGWPLLQGPSQVFESNTVGGLCCGDLRRCLHQTQCGWPLLRGPSQVFASNTVWVASVAGTFAVVCIKHSVGGLCCGDLRRCLHQTQWVASVAGTFAGVHTNTVWVASVAGTFASIHIYAISYNKLTFNGISKSTDQFEKM